MTRTFWFSVTILMWSSDESHFFLKKVNYKTFAFLGTHVLG